MSVRRRNSWNRISCIAAIVLAVLIALDALPARADALDDAFPAPHWRRGKVPNGFGFDCVTDSCGRLAQVVFTLRPANPTMVDNIKSGLINREWAEKFVASTHKSRGDTISVLNFTVQTGQVPGWSMVYECKCEGKTNYVATRTLIGDKGTMTYNALASTPEAAQQNMNKMITAMIGASGR